MVGWKRESIVVNEGDLLTLTECSPITPMIVNEYRLQFPEPFYSEALTMGMGDDDYSAALSLLKGLYDHCRNDLIFSDLAYELINHRDLYSRQCVTPEGKPYYHMPSMVRSKLREMAHFNQYMRYEHEHDGRVISGNQIIQNTICHVMNQLVLKTMLALRCTPVKHTPLFQSSAPSEMSLVGAGFLE
jgi:hypothetical protein